MKTLKRHQRRGGGQVYVVYTTARQGLKIGWSTNVERRIEILARSLKGTVHLLHATDRMLHGFHVERRAHELLVDRKLGKEWFDVRLDDAVAAIRQAEADVLSGWKWPRMKCHDAKRSKDWPERWQVSGKGRKRK